MPFCLSPRLLLARRLFAAAFESQPRTIDGVPQDTLENPPPERSHTVAAP